ncbi:L-seryl-tRNA(Sec) selenium transferase, partial [Cryptosporangium minutisporangium]
APGVVLPSAAVALPAAWAAALRAGDPPVVGRVERGALLLDLRCLPADLDDVLGDAVRAVAAREATTREDTAAGAADACTS